MTSSIVPPTRLTITDHRRDSAGLRYVYPVVSRRAGGVSVGVNLNVNNACNWACVYCQVPGLTRGAPPPVDLVLLEHELHSMFSELTEGDFMSARVPPEYRRLADIAFSGNGEPTASPDFFDAVVRAERVLHDCSLLRAVKIRLITNGSLTHQPNVQRGIAKIGELSGEIWFKLDRASEAGMRRVNGVKRTMRMVEESLDICASLAPTWIQTCYFSEDGNEPPNSDLEDYLGFIASVREKIKGVHLYGMARPSMQSVKLCQAPPEGIQAFAQRIMSLGAFVILSP